MRQIVDNLIGQEYVSANNVEALRKYIRVKNPGSSREELSAVLADALHKIVDTRIYQFEEKHRKRIKDDVLRKAVKKKEFSVNAAEVFNSCLSLKLHEDSYIESFTLWINQNQPVPVTADSVDKLVSSVEHLEAEYIEYNLDEIINDFDATWAEDQTYVSLGIEYAEAVKLPANEVEAQIPDNNPVSLIDSAESEWLERVKEFIEIPVQEEAPAFEAVEEEQPSVEEVYVEITAVEQPEAEAYTITAEAEQLVTKSYVDIAEEKHPATAEAFETIAEEQAIGEILSIVTVDRLAPIKRLAAEMLHNFKYVRPSMRLVLPAAIPVVLITALVFTDLFSDNKIHALQHQDKGKYANITEEQVDRYMSLESRVLKKLDSLKDGKALVLLDGLHEELKYEKVDDKKLRKWLEDKDSMLAEEPYFTAILATSKKYGIHPLLMFAIVGQEQAFVPKNGAAAEKIANNPFNVYGSWQNYNTNIYDSSSLAADTIIKSSRNRPVYMNAIRWINRKYAEDPNWWNGVSKLFAQMKKDIGSYMFRAKHFA